MDYIDPLRNGLCENQILTHLKGFISQVFLRSSVSMTSADANRNWNLKVQMPAAFLGAIVKINFYLLMMKLKNSLEQLVWMISNNFLWDVLMYRLAWNSHRGISASRILAQAVHICRNPSISSAGCPEQHSCGNCPLQCWWPQCGWNKCQTLPSQTTQKNYLLCFLLRFTDLTILYSHIELYLYGFIWLQALVISCDTYPFDHQKINRVAGLPPRSIAGRKSPISSGLSPMWLVDPRPKRP